MQSLAHIHRELFAVVVKSNLKYVPDVASGWLGKSTGVGKPNHVCAQHPRLAQEVGL